MPADFDREVRAVLAKAGYRPDRHGGKHDIWFSPITTRALKTASANLSWIHIKDAMCRGRYAVRGRITFQLARSMHG